MNFEYFFLVDMVRFLNIKSKEFIDVVRIVCIKFQIHRIKIYEQKVNIFLYNALVHTTLQLTRINLYLKNVFKHKYV